MNAFVLSLYIGYALYEVFPFKDTVLALGGTLAMRTIIAVLLYAIAVGISHYLLRRLGISSRGRRGLPMILLGILVAAFLFALAYNTFAITHLIVLPDIFVSLFAPTSYFFWWFIAPLVGLFFLV